MPIHVEQNLNNERVGCQDQISCAMGSISVIKYNRKNIIHKNLLIKKSRLKRLTSNLLLFYTGKHTPSKQGFERANEKK